MRCRDLCQLPFDDHLYARITVRALSCFFEQAIFDGQIGHALLQSHRLAAQIFYLR